jgi:hypothetical protein
MELKADGVYAIQLVKVAGTRRVPSLSAYTFRRFLLLSNYETRPATRTRAFVIDRGL